MHVLFKVFTNPNTWPVAPMQRTTKEAVITMMSKNEAFLGGKGTLPMMQYADVANRIRPAMPGMRGGNKEFRVHHKTFANLDNGFDIQRTKCGTHTQWPTKRRKLFPEIAHLGISNRNNLQCSKEWGLPALRTRALSRTHSRQGTSTPWPAWKCVEFWWLYPRWRIEDSS